MCFLASCRFVNKLCFSLSSGCSNRGTTKTVNAGCLWVARQLLHAEPPCGDVSCLVQEMLRQTQQRPVGWGSAAVAPGVLLHLAHCGDMQCDFWSQAGSLWASAAAEADTLPPSPYLQIEGCVTFCHKMHSHLNEAFTSKV